MNNQLFQQARDQYQAKDYQNALQAYTQCLQESDGNLAPGEAGQLYHQIGNCLVRLGNAQEAINAYSQATNDVAYDAKGQLNYNLGTAYASLHDYEDAATYFEAATTDAKYDTPYKAYTGLGNAYLKLGKSAEAGVAFRNAALDESNPDPTKALLNLGVCFMALNRPVDAVTSYESALQFQMTPDTHNRLYANLGQAYVACGQNQKAVGAFEEAIADQTYFLSDSASVDYQRAVAAMAQGAGDTTRVIDPIAADMSGLDVSATDGYSFSAQEAAASQTVPQDSLYYANPYAGQEASPYLNAEGAEQFFSASDEELEQWSKGVIKKDRKRRSVGLKIFVVLLILILAVLAGAAYLYYQGYGYPSQESVVSELFANPSSIESSVLSSEVSSDNADSIKNLLVQDNNVTVNGVDKSMTTSTAYVSAKTSEGGEVQYKVSMVRDLIGWKVSNVELYFPSQN